LAFTWAALSVVITCSSAHGASTSQSSSSSSSFVTASAPRKPCSVPVSRLCANAACTSIPLGLCKPAVESEIAITFAPSSARNFARNEPTLPNPWTATDVPCNEDCFLRTASRTQ
jgi:hypothetical protein